MYEIVLASYGAYFLVMEQIAHQGSFSEGVNYATSQVISLSLSLSLSLITYNIGTHHWY